MSNTIRISVLLPVYNAENFIAHSVQSILHQTESNFELLIIDDCSTDGTCLILESFKDSRITIYKKERNTGYTESLNWGINLAKGKYIARMDADDWSYPERFQKQYDFLEANPDIAICGTDAHVMHSDFKFNYPLDNDAIRTNLLFGSSLIHPSIMGQRKFFADFMYDPSKEPAEDYDLFVRLAIAGEKLANLKEVLLKYRAHKGQVSSTSKNKQKISANITMLNIYSQLEYDRNEFTNDLIINAICPKEKISLDELKRTLSWYRTLNDTDGFFKKHLLIKALKRKKYNLIIFYIKNNHLQEGDFSTRLKLELFKLNPIWFFKLLFKV